MIKLIIFDYDGVIVDSFPEVHKIYQKMCGKLGKECPTTLEGFLKIYGHSSSDAYKQLGFSEEDILKGNKIFKKELGKVKSPLFKGIKRVLEILSRDYPLVIISSGYREDIEKKLKNFDLLNYFKKVLGRESVEIIRFEKADTIREILKKYNLKPKEVLLIGDRNIDFIEGSLGGLKNILLVDYGWGYDLDLIPEYKQKAVIKKPEDILENVDKF